MYIFNINVVFEEHFKFEEYLFIEQNKSKSRTEDRCPQGRGKTFQEEKMSLTKVVRGRAKTAKPPYGAQFMENVQKLS